MNIESLKENEVFVFGSNLEGSHIGGAARTALDKFGAVNGECEGLQGQSYAIPTCLVPGVPFASSSDMIVYVDEFKEFAKGRPDLSFLVTPVGTGVAGFSLEEVDAMFAGSPDNVTLLWREL